MPEPQVGNVLSLLTNLLNTQSNKPSDVVKTFQKRQQLLRWLASDTKGSGSDWSETVVYKHARGTGKTRLIAQAAASGAAGRAKLAKWKGEWATHKGSLFIAEEVISRVAAGKEETRAFLDVQADGMETTIAKMGDDLEEEIWAGAGHAIAYGTLDAGVFTPSDKLVLGSLQPGDQLEASANDGTSADHATYQTLGYVIKCNGNASTVTISGTDGGAAGTPAGWGSSVYLFRRGAFGGGTNPEIGLYSLPIWIPATDPETTFLNVDRTVDVVAFSGVRLIANEIASSSRIATIKAMITKWFYQGFDLGGKKGIWVHPEIWDECANELEVKGQRIIDGKNAESGLASFSINTVAGTFEVMAARGCSYNRGYLIDRDAFRFRSIKEMIRRSMTQFGTSAVVGDTIDQFEWRWVFEGQLQCLCPSACATCYFSGSPSLF